MRTTVNIEFSRKDLVEFVHDLGRRWTLSTIADVARSVRVDPTFLRTLAQMFQQSVETGMRAGRRDRRRNRRPRMDAEFEEGVPYQWSGGPDDGPRPYPPGASPYPPPPGSPGPQPLTRCVNVPEHDLHEAGWICHECGVINGEHRVACRRCKHLNCAHQTDAGEAPGVDGDPDTPTGEA